MLPVPTRSSPSPPSAALCLCKDMPSKYIYEPWTAPLSVQQAAKCVIGRDYPAPIVDHATVLKANMERMKAGECARGVQLLLPACCLGQANPLLLLCTICAPCHPSDAATRVHSIE